MATMYLMSLEDRVELARNQLDLVILKLRSVKDQSRLDEIQPTQTAAHLKFLSHDLLEGRAPSTRGGQLAAEYLATQLALLGYEPVGEGGCRLPAGGGGDACR